MASTATLEHLRSRLHPDGRSQRSETRLAHFACNQTHGTIEEALVAGRPLSPQQRGWLEAVAERRGLLEPIARLAVERLLWLLEHPGDRGRI